MMNRLRLNCGHTQAGRINFIIGQLFEARLGDTINGQTIALPPPLADEARQGAGGVAFKRKTRAGSGAQTLRSGPAAMKAPGSAGSISSATNCATPPSSGTSAASCATRSFTDVLLLGMGGSSLGPEVLAKSSGIGAGLSQVHVLDSTDPDQVRRFESGIDIARTALHRFQQVRARRSSRMF